jgi:hypothetical protein
MSHNDQESDIEVISVTYRPDEIGDVGSDEYDYESGYGGLDATGDIVHAGLNPNGFARDKTEQIVNYVGVKGDINYGVIGQIKGHTQENPTVEEALVDFATEKAIEKAAENVAPGIAPIALGVSDHFNFKSKHKETIKDMASRNIDGFEYVEEDINGDGYVDKVYIDATSVLQNSDNEPVYYIEDGKIFTPDEIREFAENRAWNTSDDLYAKSMDAVEEGKNPNKVYRNYLKTELATSPDATDNGQVLKTDADLDADLDEYLALEEEEAAANIGTTDIAMSSDASNPDIGGEHAQPSIQKSEVKLAQLTITP